MKKLIFIVLIGLTSMQVFAHASFADTGVGVSDYSCASARSEASSARRADRFTTITSKSMGSCEKNPDGDYIVRWVATGYSSGRHDDADHSHSGSSNAQSGSAKSFTTKLK